MRSKEGWLPFPEPVLSEGSTSRFEQMPGKCSKPRRTQGTNKKLFSDIWRFVVKKRLEMLDLGRKEKYIYNIAKRNHILTHHLRVQMGCDKCKPKLTRAALKITDKYNQADFWLKGSYYTLTSLLLELLKSCVLSQTKTRSHVFHGARASKSQLQQVCDKRLLPWTAGPAHTWLPAGQEPLTSARTFTSKEILN